MKAPSFAARRRGWSSPPVDDVGYLPSAGLLELTDENLIAVVKAAERARYTGWRNWNGNWRRVLGLDSTTGKVVLDYGCGIGLEALQYAKAGNTVILADIAEGNAFLASRVLRLFGYEPGATIVLREGRPFADIGDASLDVVACNGVLHHIPKPGPVVAQFARWLKPGGELRLMVYSDAAWRIATASDPPDDVLEHPSFRTYVDTWDAVGGYADWYDRAKIDRLCRPHGLSVVACEPLTERGEYLGAVLRKDPA